MGFITKIVYFMLYCKHNNRKKGSQRYCHADDNTFFIMKLNYNICPCIMCKNEDYWIYYTLRDLVKVFGSALVLDTGSTDKTKDIIKTYYPQVKLIEEDYGNDDKKIGNGRNVLREECPTEWMFLVDADEVWREDKLQVIINTNIQPQVEVVMVAGWNVQDVDGQLMLRTNDLANRDGLFSKNIKWNRLDYPFEGYGLVENYISQGKGQYIPAPTCYAWHVRHTQRSSKNWDAFFRKNKMGFYPYSGPFEPMPKDWIGEINPDIFNPYLSTQ